MHDEGSLFLFIVSLSISVCTV